MWKCAWHDQTMRRTEADKVRAKNVSVHYLSHAKTRSHCVTHASQQILRTSLLGHLCRGTEMFLNGPGGPCRFSFMSWKETAETKPFLKD